MDSSAALGHAVRRLLLGIAVRLTPYNPCVLPFLARASVVARLGPCYDDQGDRSSTAWRRDLHERARPGRHAEGRALVSLCSSDHRYVVRAARHCLHRHSRWRVSSTLDFVATACLPLGGELWYLAPALVADLFVAAG